jgi:hypothetical protein
MNKLRCAGLLHERELIPGGMPPIAQAGRLLKYESLTSHEKMAKRLF